MHRCGRRYSRFRLEIVNQPVAVVHISWPTVPQGEPMHS